MELQDFGTLLICKVARKSGPSSREPDIPGYSFACYLRLRNFLDHLYQRNQNSQRPWSSMTCHGSLSLGRRAHKSLIPSPRNHRGRSAST